MRLSGQLAVGASVAALAAALCLPVFGQDTRWKPVGRGGIELGLAGPAGAAVSETWFSPDGGALYVLLRSGATWSTADLGQTWRSEDALAQADRAARFADRPAGGGAAGRIVRDPFGPAVQYFLGRDLLRSRDGGRSWTNLTNGGAGSVIGERQVDIAFSPQDPDLVVVGNSLGLWKSVDRGITWSSLNRTLPNFPRVAFLPMNGPGGLRIRADAMGELELSGAAAFRQLRRRPARPPAGWGGEDDARRSPKPPILPPGFAVSYRVWKDGAPISPDLTACAVAPCQDPRRHYLTALENNGRLWAGTSDGRIWVSRNGGEDWRLSFRDAEERRILRIWVDPENAAAALAVAGARVLRSTNGGAFWDDVGSNLPAGAWQAVVGHPDARAVYVAGAAGVFYSRVDLDKPGPPGVWRRLNGNLPAQAVDDLTVDFAAGRLYAAQAGYGVYRARAPVVEEAIRALNAADLSRRPAAPGSLLTIRGMAADRAEAGNARAPILSRGRRETQLQVPFNQAGRSLGLTLWAGLRKFELSMPLARVSPAIFIEDGEPLILDAGSGAIVGRNRPARPGARLLILATGLGRVVPDWPAGLAAPFVEPPRPAAEIGASLNGAALSVISARLAGGYVGTYVVEAALPPTAAVGVGVLRIYADGVGSNAARLVIEP